MLTYTLKISRIFRVNWNEQIAKIDLLHKYDNNATLLSLFMNKTGDTYLIYQNLNLHC